MTLLYSYRYYLRTASFFGVAPYSFAGTDFRVNRIFECVTVFYMAGMLAAFILSLCGYGKIDHGKLEAEIFGLAVIIRMPDFVIHFYLFFVTSLVFYHRKEIVYHLNRVNRHRLMISTGRKYFESKIHFTVTYSLYVVFMLFSNWIGLPKDEFFYFFFALLFAFIMNAILSQFFIFLEMASTAYLKMAEEIRGRFVGVNLIREFCLYDEIIKDFIFMLETVFGPNLLLFSSLCMLYTAQVEIFVVNAGIFSETAIRSYFASLSPFLFIFCVTYVFRVIVNAADNLVAVLHEFGADNHHAPILLEYVELFSLQLLHRKVELKIGGFDNLDFSLPYKIVGAVTAIIIVLLQFQMMDSTANCPILNTTTCPCP